MESVIENPQIIKFLSDLGITEYRIEDSLGCLQVLVGGHVALVIGKPDLLCSGCHIASIPRPVGATKDSRYFCSICSELGTADGAEFDRCAFDDVKNHPRRSSADWIVDGGESILRSFFARRYLPSADEGRSLDDWIDAGCSAAYDPKDCSHEIAFPLCQRCQIRAFFFASGGESATAPSKRIMQVRQNEEVDWNVVATRENLRRLFTKPNDRRKVLMFVAYYWSGISQEEIANRFNCSVGAVKQNISRVRKVLINNILQAR